jgi:hypothetical protein
MYFVFVHVFMHVILSFLVVLVIFVVAGLLIFVCQLSTGVFDCSCRISFVVVCCFSFFLCVGCLELVVDRLCYSLKIIEKEENNLRNI